MIRNVCKTNDSESDRKTSNHLGMKKKRDYSDEDDDSQDQKGKTTESKRRGQVFSKQQDEAPVANDIKSMFAATKTRNVQRQEQVQ